MQPYYDHQGITIYLGDCREVLPGVPRADHVITDPPFGAKVHKGARGGADGSAPLVPFDSIDVGYLRSVYAQCAPNRWVVSFIDWRHIGPLEDEPPEGLRFVRFGVWTKPNGAPQFTGDRPGTGWDAIAILHSAGAGRMRWNGGGRTAVWNYNIALTGQGHGPSLHPTTKPQQRRPKGDGQLSWDDKRQAWRARVVIATGATRVRYFAARQSGSRRQAEADAKAWLKAQTAAKQAGRNLRAARMSIDAAVAEWLASRDYLADSTLTNYRTIALHISDAIGSTAAEDVTAVDIERMDKTHRTRLSGDYADQILTVLASVFERLIALDIVVRNPVTRYRRIIPKRARRGTPTRAPHPLDAGMLRRVLAKLDEPYRGFALWLICTGLRISELNGLRTVNVRDGVATIVEQRRSTDRHAPAKLKTDDSPRQVPIAAQLLAQTTMGRTLVFEHADGGALTQSTLRTHFARALVAAGLPHIRPHDLRHSFGRGLIGLDCPEELREALMGHQPRSQNQEYSRPPVAVLRPWVERWAGEVLGGEGQKLSSNVL